MPRIPKGYRGRQGDGLADAAAVPLPGRQKRPVVRLLALACAVLCCSCSIVDPAPIAAVLPESGALRAEPRGIVGEPCPPALAAKGYC